MSRSKTGSHTVITPLFRNMEVLLHPTQVYHRTNCTTAIATEALDKKLNDTYEKTGISSTPRNPMWLQGSAPVGAIKGHAFSHLDSTADQFKMPDGEIVVVWKKKKMGTELHPDLTIEEVLALGSNNSAAQSGTVCYNCPPAPPLYQEADGRGGKAVILLPLTAKLKSYSEVLKACGPNVLLKKEFVLVIHKLSCNLMAGYKRNHQVDQIRELEFARANALSVKLFGADAYLSREEASKKVWTSVDLIQEAYEHYRETLTNTVREWETMISLLHVKFAPSGHNEAIPVAEQPPRWSGLRQIGDKKSGEWNKNPANTDIFAFQRKGADEVELSSRVAAGKYTDADFADLPQGSVLNTDDTALAKLFAEVITEGVLVQNFLPIVQNAEEGQEPPEPQLDPEKPYKEREGLDIFIDSTVSPSYASEKTSKRKKTADGYAVATDSKDLSKRFLQGEVNSVKDAKCNIVHDGVKITLTKIAYTLYSMTFKQVSDVARVFKSTLQIRETIQREKRGHQNEKDERVRKERFPPWNLLLEETKTVEGKKLGKGHYMRRCKALEDAAVEAKKKVFEMLIGLESDMIWALGKVANNGNEIILADDLQHDYDTEEELIVSETIIPNLFPDPEGDEEEDMQVEGGDGAGA